MHEKCILMTLYFSTSFTLANIVTLDSSIQKTSNGSSLQLRLPDGMNANVLYWSDVTETAFDLVLKYNGAVYFWGVGGTKKTVLRVPVTQTQTWLFANFVGQHISFTGVNDTNLYRIKTILFGREITVSSNDTIYWHLCKGYYACDFMPPVVADVEGYTTQEDPTSENTHSSRYPHLPFARSGRGPSYTKDTAAPSQDTSEDSNTTVTTLASLAGVLILVIFGLVLFILFKTELNLGHRDEMTTRVCENTPKVDEEVL